MGFPDPSRTVRWYCTGRVYISTLSLTLGRHFLCSIIIDRFLVTSTSFKRRQMSSFKVAKWYVPLSVLCWMIFYLHMWVGYSNYQDGSACKRWVGAYTLFITVSTVIIESALPIIVMTTFSLLTLKNLHRSRQKCNRVMPLTQANRMIAMRPVAMNIVNSKSIQNLPSNKQNRREKKKIERQLTLISLIEIIVYIMFNTPDSSYSVYGIITSAIIRSADRAAIESFISGICIILTFIYGTVS